MVKVYFAKCFSSHGIFLCAYDFSKNVIAAYYPLYKEFCVFDRNYSWLENIMRSVHFDHQFEEIPRWQAQNNFLIRKKEKEEELKTKKRYEKLHANLCSIRAHT